MLSWDAFHKWKSQVGTWSGNVFACSLHKYEKEMLHDHLVSYDDN